MTQLRVRCLGGFEARLGEERISGFESQKVRALFAYLLCGGDRSFSRDHLAGLLWPEKSEETARHALRQAAYNLRTTLDRAGCDADPILARRGEIQLNPALGPWFDVAEFERAAEASGGSEGPGDPQALVRAAQLYRGDFLAGFQIRDSSAFEEWLITEQERLREAVIEILRNLVAAYRARGEFRLGIHYGRRWVAIDPLSEAGHRALMRLFAYSGRRSRALAQYETLREMLNSELGVEPLAETRELYEKLLSEASSDVPVDRSGVAVGPVIPLVGRGEALERLRRAWATILAGRGRLTLVRGPGGVGKTRLIRSFLDSSSSQRPALILMGRAYDLQPPISFQPFAEALRGAVVAEADESEAALASAGAEILAGIAALVPELAALRPELDPPPPLDGPGARERFFDQVAAFLSLLTRRSVRSAGDEPVVLFLDDLHWADRATVDLLLHLVEALDGAPVWLIASFRDAAPGRRPIQASARSLAEREEIDLIDVGPLEPTGVREIASALVGERGSAELAGLLAGWSDGLPLAIAEVINALWDEGVLVGEESGTWSLRRAPGEAALPEAGDLAELVLRRVRQMPTSTRRLASLAAIAGQKFDAELLRAAAHEHLAVVEVALEFLLERWLIRQNADLWTTGRRESDLVLWARGARRGNFEFAHKAIRRAIYESIHPLRRQVMHREVAEALEKLHGDSPELVAELLAHHYSEAGIWERAFAYLEISGDRAAALRVEENAAHYWRKGVEAGRHLAAAAGGESEREEWERRSGEIGAKLEKLSASS